MSFAYILLYLTALNSGVLMSTYLLTHGITKVEISLFRGIFLTFFSVRLFKRYGIEKVRHYVVLFQGLTLPFVSLFQILACFLHFLIERHYTNIETYSSFYSSWQF